MIDYSIKDYPYSAYVFVPYIIYIAENPLGAPGIINWCANNFGSLYMAGNKAIGKWFYTIGDGNNGYDMNFRFKKKNDFIVFMLTWG